MRKNSTAASEYFNASRSSDYNRKIRASIPGYESLHDMTGDIMAATVPQKANILVVGAGTGMEIVTLGDANPEWTFTAVDISDEMLTICKSNVHSAGLSSRVRIHCGGVDGISEGQSYDAATSILVSHFIRDAESRIAFFSSMAERIVSGGLLVTADITADKSDPAFELFLKAWKSHYSKAGIAKKEVEEDFDRAMNTVSFTPENAVMNMLEAGGFRSVYQFYRAFLFCGWFCFKA